jgi:hypothetical protein
MSLVIFVISKQSLPKNKEINKRQKNNNNNTDNKVGLRTNLFWPITR